MIDLRSESHRLVLSFETVLFSYVLCSKAAASVLVAGRSMNLLGRFWYYFYLRAIILSKLIDFRAISLNGSYDP